MSLPLRTESYSIEEYFALERASERRFEYRNGEIVCMSGGTIEHAATTSNIVSYLKMKLRGGSCSVYGSDLAVYAPAGQPYRYPDVSVVCEEPCIVQVDGRDCLENPILLVEVLSPMSADYDRRHKIRGIQVDPNADRLPACRAGPPPPSAPHPAGSQHLAGDRFRLTR